MFAPQRVDDRIHRPAPADMQRKKREEPTRLGGTDANAGLIVEVNLNTAEQSNFHRSSLAPAALQVVHAL